MACTFRPGQPPDAEAVLELWAIAGAEPSHTDDVESLHRLIRHDPAALIVAEDGGSIVGSVIAAWDGWRGSISRLPAPPSHRRKGLARQLLREAEARLAAAAAVRLQAIVVDTAPMAVSFWDASGWERQ